MDRETDSENEKVLLFPDSIITWGGTDMAGEEGETVKMNSWTVRTVRTEKRTIQTGWKAEGKRNLLGARSKLDKYDQRTVVISENISEKLLS